MDEYIKRNELVSIYKKWLPQLESKEDEGDRRGVETCIAVLEDMLAADVAPVVHGRWIPCDNGGYYCSNCDHRVAFRVGQRHCHHCGARMDGERE